MVCLIWFLPIAFLGCRLSAYLGCLVRTVTRLHSQSAISSAPTTDRTPASTPVPSAHPIIIYRKYHGPAACALAERSRRGQSGARVSAPTPSVTCVRTPSKSIAALSESGLGSARPRLVPYPTCSTALTAGAIRTSNEGPGNTEEHRARGHVTERQVRLVVRASVTSAHSAHPASALRRTRNVNNNRCIPVQSSRLVRASSTDT
ncbi:hypothetical protein BV20DRAFT_594654 [Pilatotrama ljubarskyi]|nr:hypothetical protein BV20DRAFT_594654 [Pilatotrama ljubarskyi]